MKAAKVRALAPSVATCRQRGAQQDNRQAQGCCFHQVLLTRVACCRVSTWPSLADPSSIHSPADEWMIAAKRRSAPPLLTLDPVGQQAQPLGRAVARPARPESVAAVSKAMQLNFLSHSREGFGIDQRLFNGHDLVVISM